MGIRPHIEIVIGALVKSSEQYKVKEIDFDALDGITLGEVEDKKLSLFSHSDAKDYLVDRLHFGYINSERDDYIIGFTHKRCDTGFGYLTIDLFANQLKLDGDEYYAYTEIPQMENCEIEHRKKQHVRRGFCKDDWELAVKENRCIKHEPHPSITKMFWDAAEKCLLYAGYAIPREEMKMYFVMYWF